MSKRKFHIFWAQIAKQDLEQIISFIEADSPKSAQNLLLKLKKKVSSLYTSPLRGRIIPELYDLKITTYREIIISPYRVMYRVEDSTVFVLGVFDSRRNLGEIIFERILRIDLS